MNLWCITSRYCAEFMMYQSIVNYVSKTSPNVGNSLLYFLVISVLRVMCDDRLTTRKVVRVCVVMHIIKHQVFACVLLTHAIKQRGFRI